MIPLAEKTDAQKKAQKEYMSHKTRIEIVLSPEKHKRIKDHAESRGESVATFVKRAVDETMERDGEI